jgi:hypothetical protein
VTSLGLPSTQPDITTLERQARAVKRPDLPRSGRYAASRQARRPLISRLMAERPTGVWRERVASDAGGIASRNS